MCGYPLRWPNGAESISAPIELVEIGRDWHGGQWSGLYSVSSTGKIFASKARDIESELRNIATRGKIPAGPGPSAETFRLHMLAIEQLADQLPDETSVDCACGNGYTMAGDDVCYVCAIQRSIDSGS
jgi:hypothetical protein